MAWKAWYAVGKKTMGELGIDEGRFAIDKEEYSSYCSLCLADVIEILNSAAYAANGKIGE